MEIVFLLILILVFSINIFLGIFLFSKPEKAIKIQESFYEKINWKIEPVSMQKEVRNTRIMGMSLIAVALSMIVYFFTCRM